MKIGMLVNNMEVSGGYHKLVIRLAQQLERKGHKVIIYTIAVDRKQCYPDDIDSVKIEELNERERKDSLVEQFEQLADKMPGDLDAVIIHDPLSLRAIATFTAKKNTKIIWMLNNQLSPADIGMSAQRGRVRSMLGSKTQPQSTKDEKYMREGLKKVTDYVTYDKFNKKLVKKYLGRTATVVYAGADLERFRRYAKQRSFNKKKVYTILSVGVAFPHRRYEDLIKAASILRQKGVNFKIVIVGRQDLHQEYSEKLKALVAEEDTSDLIVFKNYVSDSEMISLYRDSDVFIFINDGFTWGIAVFEAVAAKLPVVITNNIGAADLITNGKSGWVIKPRSPKEVAKAIQDAINHRKKAEEIADTAYKELMGFVSWEAYANRIIEVIKS